MAAPITTHSQSNQGLPSIASLTNGLPSASSQHSPHPLSPEPHQSEQIRDSGTWPQPSSKHNSANSGLQVHTLLNPDDSPPGRSVPSTPLSARVPDSATGSQLPSINQGFQDAGNRASVDTYHSFDSRRSSVDSRMHHQMSGLYINGPTSPYQSNNNSQVSLAASLRRPNGTQPMSPLSGRSGPRGHPTPRVAPPIMPVNRMPGAPVATAEKPTPGYAWAFPDQAIPEERRDSDSGDSSNTGPGVSRQNSYAASSVRSSIFSNDSHLPAGQRRFDDEAATTHHHTMQHRSIQNLQTEGLPAQTVGNYSRTPELRVSHKLAERKRRSEMKDLFEELNKAVPSNGGTKASKWEILTKAIEYIRNTQNQERHLNAQVERLHRDSDYAREAQKENDMLKTEIQVMHQHLRRLDPNAPHVYGHFTSQLTAPPPQANGASGISLPPLQSGGHPPPQSAHGPPQQPYGNGVPPPAAAAMQGVEYGAYGR